MKKMIIGAGFLAAMVVFACAGCAVKSSVGEPNADVDVKYVGVNAEVLEISSEEMIFVVKGLDADSILGDRCYIDCENPGTYFVYVDAASEDVQEIKYQDFRVGDQITVDVDTVENSYTVASRIQLITPA